ncbi:hypothetical protein N0V88_003780 [Collariella sp. IMI 366227]|nr:hypothetical protein N0V88_003780 [Collariella sp. IMI 366227]
MLLTSSLSIETIRAYSKKVKHRTDLECHLRSNTDSSSVYSSNSLNAKLPKRWNINLLSHVRRSSKQHQPYYHTLPRPFPQSPEASSSSFTPHPSPTPNPIWAPIKRIFPTATSHLCDSLYAHLIAYNYISSICPPIPIPPRTALAMPSPHIRPSTSFQNQDTRIPQKAATLLGMDDPVSATAIYHHPQNHKGDDEER